MHILPKKLYVESITRSDECFERFYFHILLQNMMAGTVDAEKVEIVLRNPELGSTLRQTFEGRLLQELFLQSQPFIDKADEAGPAIHPLKKRGIVDHHLEVKGHLRFSEVECHFAGRDSNGNPVVGATRRELCRDKPSTVLTLPVRGRWWVAGGHSSLEPHSRSYLPALTYAYDFVQIGQGTKSYRNDGARNSDYFCYGEDVLAAADGEVVVATDGVEENLPSKTPADAPECYQSPASIPMPGNHVVIKHAEGEYTFYAHLQPRIRVRVGQKVRRYQLLGRVGNSGESTEPHLHFHLADGVSLNASNGMPIAFSNWLEDAFSISPGRVEEGIMLSREIIASAEDNDG